MFCKHILKINKEYPERNNNGESSLKVVEDSEKWEVIDNTGGEKKWRKRTKTYFKINENVYKIY